VGTAAIGYLQQLLPSQQAGVPQHVATVAARADNERKRTAANANTSALSFITISFDMVFETQARPARFDALLLEMWRRALI
jgi:hypothetical protein